MREALRHALSGTDRNGSVVVGSLSHSEYTPVRHFSGGHKRCGSFAALKGLSLPSVHVSQLRRRMGMWWKRGSPAPIFDNPLQERSRELLGHLGWSG